MTDKQPAQFDWATELSDAQGHVTLSKQEAKEIGARLRSMSAKLKAYEDHAAELRRLHAYCQELESQVVLDCMTHVQNPAENEHVANDVSKNGAELNMSTQQPAPATQQAGEVVAYLDIGAGGYLDLGTDLTDEALSRLPKGRHALVIAGTYGIDGYTAAPTTQPAPAAQGDALDAARYRYLRDGDWRECDKLESIIRLQLNSLWDAAIDAASKQGENHD